MSQPHYKYCSDPLCVGIIRETATWCRFCSKPDADNVGDDPVILIFLDLFPWFESLDDLFDALPDSPLTDFLLCLYEDCQPILMDLLDSHGVETLRNRILVHGCPGAGQRWLIGEILSLIESAGLAPSDFVLRGRQKLLERLVIGAGDSDKRSMTEGMSNTKICEFCSESIADSSLCPYCSKQGQSIQEAFETSMPPWLSKLDEPFVRSLLLFSFALDAAADSGNGFGALETRLLSKHRIEIAEIESLSRVLNAAEVENSSSEAWSIVSDAIRSRKLSKARLELLERNREATPLCAWSSQLRENSEPYEAFNTFQIFEQARVLKSMGRLEDSRIIFEFVLDELALRGTDLIHPSIHESECYEELADILFRVERLDEAVDLLEVSIEKAQSVRTNSYRQHFMLSRIFLQQGDVERAHREIEIALEKVSGMDELLCEILSASLLHQLGRVYLARKGYDEVEALALRSLKEGSRFNLSNLYGPGFAEVLAYVRQEQQRYDEAAGQFAYTIKEKLGAIMFNIRNAFESGTSPLMVLDLCRECALLISSLSSLFESGSIASGHGTDSLIRDAERIKLIGDEFAKLNSRNNLQSLEERVRTLSGRFEGQG